MAQCTTRTINISSNECVGDSLDTYTNNFEFLDAITCNLEFSANNIWPSGLSTVKDLSGDAQSTIHHVGWESTFVTTSALSSDWLSVFSTVAALSSEWAGEIEIVYTCPIASLTVDTEVTIKTFLNTIFPATDFMIGTRARVFCIDQSEWQSYREENTDYAGYGLYGSAWGGPILRFEDAALPAGVNCDDSGNDICYTPANDVYINKIARFEYVCEGTFHSESQFGINKSPLVYGIPLVGSETYVSNWTPVKIDQKSREWVFKGYASGENNTIYS